MEVGINAPTIERPPSRERISNDELANLISAVGNHEVKAFTLLAMKNDTIYTAPDLYEEVMQKQGKGGWPLHFKGPLQYCETSLAPIGLVAQEVLDPADPLSTWGYMKTEFGRNSGDILAASMLKFSYEHPDFSLIDFFSKTGSNSSSVTTAEDGTEVKKRSPLVRQKIFWELATSQLPIRLTDLAERIGETTHGISQHLAALNDYKIINYETTDPHESSAFYQFSKDAPDQPPEWRSRAFVKFFIYSTLLQHPDTQWTNESLADYYLASLPQEAQKAIRKDSLQHNISKTLNQLLRDGYATRGKFSRYNKSEITLTEQQEIAISDLVTLLDRFQNNDPALIQEAKEFKDFLMSHPEAVANLFKKAKDHSTHANSKSPEETMSDIMSIISDSQSPLTNAEIQKVLEQNQKRHLSRNSVQHYTLKLAREGKISIASLEKGIKRFTITNQ